MLDAAVANQRSGVTRRSLLIGAGTAAVALYLWEPGQVAGAPAAGWADADYWAFADRMQPLLDRSWRREPHGAYFPQPGGGGTQHNANMLFTHAAAARMGHTGAARNDERARLLVARLCASPPWRTDAPGSSAGCPSAQPSVMLAGDQTHACGWGSGLITTSRQHVVIDTEVVRGLAQAYDARVAACPSREHARADPRPPRQGGQQHVLRLPGAAAEPDQLADRDLRARGRRARHARTCCATTASCSSARFADALTHPAAGMRSPNTGPGYRFHYLPQLRADHRVEPRLRRVRDHRLRGAAVLRQARADGMAGLNANQLAHMRAWVDRVLCGYWTHGGYLNWDTGLGFARWHQIKKPPLCQQSLLAIALSPRFQPSPAYGRWARYLFDRGLELFDRLTRGAADCRPG